MITDLNLLATTERRTESEACSELWVLLRAIGDDKPAVDRTRIRGLISARTGLNPLDAIEKLRSEFQRYPEGFRTLLRVIPVLVTVSTKLDNLVETSHKLAERMGKEESYRITVEKRRSHLRSREVIEAIAEGIPQKVNLENPDWIVLIEIIGKITGVSVIRPENILNIQKERARLAA